MGKRVIQGRIQGMIGIFSFLLLEQCATAQSPLQFADLATAYKAKTLCSGVFVSKRSTEAIINTDLNPNQLGQKFAPFKNTYNQIKISVSPTEQSVTANLPGTSTRKAIFRSGFGCTLVLGTSESHLRAQMKGVSLPTRSTPPEQLWPMGDRVQTDNPLPEVNARRLQRAIDLNFANNDSDQTRALVVVYQGRIIAERYATGFAADTPQLGQSMTKSVINALVGILVQQGKLSLQDRNLLPEWRQPGDRRATISLDHLLHMTSGLAFRADPTDPSSDTIRMLFGSGDMASYAAQKPLDLPPGFKWSYGGGNTNIVSRLLHHVLGNNTAYWIFPHKALFERLGMSSAVLELDASTFVGSSGLYATARDWARFGLLYLQDGVWNGQRILPQGWVDYSRTATLQNNYGAHFWLSPKAAQADADSPLPADALFAEGVGGQYVIIVPSRQIVIVRLGLNDWTQGDRFGRHLLQAIRPSVISKLNKSFQTR
jgi:CubicO group peptidase (beta-lactamase class C family)